MKYAILIVGSALGDKSEFDGKYVKSYDPHDGLHGKLVVTADLQNAKHYGDVGDAFLDWKATNKNHPLRSDGKPNRPLTAFTITTVSIP